MRRKKEDYFVIALGVILVVVVSIIAVIVNTNSRSPERELTDITPPVSISIVPTRDTINTRPPLLYDERADAKLLDLTKNRRPVSNSDALAKAKILTLLPQDKISGIVHETRNIRIDYTQSADVFQVEILTTDISVAKSEANVWFREQGLSQEAICILPISFYVSHAVANQIRDTNIVVSSLGNGCN